MLVIIITNTQWKLDKTILKKKKDSMLMVRVILSVFQVMVLKKPLLVEHLVHLEEAVAKVP